MLFSGLFRFDKDSNLQLGYDSENKELTEATNTDSEGNVTDLLSGGGSSDFITAKLTVINNKQWAIQAAECPNVLVEEEMLAGGFNVEDNSQSVIDVIIYKGHAYIFEIVTGDHLDTPVDLETEASLTGNAAYNAEEGFIDITGDCTITIS